MRSSTVNLGIDKQAIAYLFVKAHDFGETYNGVNASVALPQVQYNGPGSPGIAIQYHIPSASSYDWSSFQTLFANDSYAVWPEQLTNGFVAGRDADGINFTNQEQRTRIRSSQELSLVWQAEPCCRQFRKPFTPTIDRGIGTGGSASSARKRLVTSS